MLVMFMYLIGLSASGLAEQKKVFSSEGQEYEVHYMALNSGVLDPQVAAQYGLKRSRALGFLNISVLKREGKHSSKAVPAMVEAKMRNDLQQVQFLSFQPVREANARYYIAQFPHREGELLTFTVTIYPEGVKEPFAFEFSQNFFSEKGASH